jgi:hypothetical protein
MYTPLAIVASIVVLGMVAMVAVFFGDRNRTAPAQPTVVYLGSCPGCSGYCGHGPCPNSEAVSSLQAQIDDLRRDHQSLADRVGRLRDRVNSIGARAVSLWLSYRILRTDVDSLRADLDATRTDVDRLSDAPTIPDHTHRISRTRRVLRRMSLLWGIIGALIGAAVGAATSWWLLPKSWFHHVVTQSITVKGVTATAKHIDYNFWPQVGITLALAVIVGIALAYLMGRREHYMAPDTDRTGPAEPIIP